MTIKILADSACDFYETHDKTYHKEMIPINVNLSGHYYQDRIDIKPNKVNDDMREGKSPKTSQVTPQAFKTIFTSYAEANQPLVYLAFSSELSGTYQTAKMIEQEVKEAYPDAELHVVDTKCASIGYGLVILRAAQLAKDGAGRSEERRVGKEWG